MPRRSGSPVTVQVEDAFQTSSGEKRFPDRSMAYLLHLITTCDAGSGRTSSNVGVSLEMSSVPLQERFGRDDGQQGDTLTEAHCEYNGNEVMAATRCTSITECLNHARKIS